MQQSKCCVLPLDDTPVFSFNLNPATVAGYGAFALFADGSEPLRQKTHTPDSAVCEAYRGFAATPTNLRIKLSKCCVLPLDNTPVFNCKNKSLGNSGPRLLFVGWKMGFEPTVSSATNWRFNRLSYIHHDTNLIIPQWLELSSVFCIILNKNTPYN